MALHSVLEIKDRSCGVIKVLGVGNTQWCLGPIPASVLESCSRWCSGYTVELGVLPGFPV